MEQIQIKDARQEFPHNFNDLIADESALWRAAIERGQHLSNEQLESETAIIGLRKELLDAKTNLFQFEVETGARRWLEEHVEGFRFPQYPRPLLTDPHVEAADVPKLKEALENLKTWQTFYTHGIELIDRNLNDPQNLAIETAGYYKADSDSLLTNSARISLDDANLKPEFMSRQLWLKMKLKLEEAKKILEHAVEFSHKREKDLAAEIAARMEAQSKIDAAHQLKIIRKATEAARKDKTKMGKLQKKAMKELQKKQKPSLKLIVDFSDTYKHFQEQEHIYQVESEKLREIAVEKPDFPSLTIEETHPLKKYLRK
jgi:hypothetical protein